MHLSPRVLLAALSLLVLPLGSSQERFTDRAALPPDPLPGAAASTGHRFGPGPLHKVVVRAGDGDVLAGLRADGAVARELDYGAFTVAQVDERLVAGGRAAFQGLGLTVRDELDLILFDRFTIDGTRPAESLRELDRSQTIGDPLDAGLDPLAGLYVVQFVGPVRDEWLAELSSIGARVVQYVPMNAYVVQLAPEGVWLLEALAESGESVQYAGVYQPALRLTPPLRELARLGSGQAVPLTVQVVNGPGVRDAVHDVTAFAERVVSHAQVGPYVNLRLDVHPAYLNTIASHPSVFAVEERGELERLDERQGQISADVLSGTQVGAPGYLAWLAGKGFDSSQFGSFSVNVVDDATSLTGHPDLPGGRIDFTLNPTSQSGTQGGHGFLNAHIVAGFNNGTGSANEDAGGHNYGLGIAPWAHVGSTAIFGPGGLNPTSYEGNAYNSGSRISTNSWSFIDGAQNPIPDYDSWSQEYDALTRDTRTAQGGNQELLVLFSAGNDGSGGNTVSTPSTAKNVLTVGASENDRTTGTDGCGVPNSGANNVDQIIAFSSRGPVNLAGGDGRWKPEIVAPGTHIQAGVPQSNYNGSSVCNQYWPSGQTLYGWSSGTSHSTPAVAGGAALVYQWFLNQAMPAPSPAMMKAVLVDAGEYMSGTGAGDTLPSNSQGMGRMNLERSFDGTARLFVDQTDVLGSTGASFVQAGSVADVGQPFRVSLVWTDAPGPTTGAPFVNDLDLTVDVAGNTYRGNVFSGANSITGGSADFRNNTESVFLPAGTAGAFTVTVTAASIGGDGVPGNGDSTDQDFALVIHNGTTGGGGGPIASFTGTPTSGLTPLAVDFTDASTGGVMSWSWTFGDGGSSSLQDPSHVYTSAGTYTVELTVDAPGGTDTLTRTNYITVTDPPPPGVSDGSFESQTAGTAPTTPWAVDFGTGHTVNPDGASSDNGMPSDGTQWAEIAADSTDGATPPSNPGGVTNPPIGGAGISQDFTYASGQTVLEFDASFLRNEGANQAQYNDWMSVDVTDGSTTWNLFYKDTFSAAALTSTKYGYAMTAVETVSVDLAVLFPSSTTSTLFTLTAQVGNGFDDFQPSRGYVDDFRMPAPAGPPTAEFVGSPLAGTAPLNVSFTDQSVGSVTSWSWTFGDGGTSTTQSPSHQYNSAGIYTVSLTATGPGGLDTETKVGYVTVTDPPPVADFIGTPTSGEAPLAVDFTDQSTGIVTSWSWTFGDGGTSTAQNPSHVYNAAGTYSVTLTATGPGGADGETKAAYITVTEPPPVAEFSGTPTTGDAPLAVNFSDLSTGAVTSWSWTFGDGGTSTAQNPSHVYNAAGTYSVTLTATGPGGADGETKAAYITVTEPPPVAEFSGTPTTGDAPLAVNFSDLSTGAVTSWSWTFGDGGTSSLQNPSHVYNAAGTYSVTLTATGPGGADGETKAAYITVTEPPPVAEFSGTPTTGDAPLAVSFSDLSTGAVTSWSWTFGDGGTSTAQNPSHVYNAAGTYSVTLTATGPGGADGETKAAYITVTEPPPVAEFSGTPTTGDAPLAVNFSDLSTGAVTSWSWTFGDGGTSTAQNPSHVYNAAGTYSVTLTATGPGGADGETKAAYITVSEPPPVAEFSGTPTTGDAPLAVNFSDLSTGAVTSWSWTFGDGGTSSLQNPSHVYNAAGTYTVTLSATGPGGTDGETKTSYITVNEPPPIAEFSGTPTTGDAPLAVNFSDLSTGAVSSWSWTFGDGGTSTAQNPSHVYNAAGTYSVTLTATGPGGADGETKASYIAVTEPPPVAEFSGTPTTGDAPLAVNFSDLSTGAVSSWSWTFGDGGTSTAQNPSHVYSAAGTYTVTLSATGPGGTDGETKTAYITANEPAPVAEFSGTPTTGNAPLAVSFSDLSAGAVTSWSWTFGDGGTSTAQNPSHVYNAVGTYSVTLTATGPGGSDGETKTSYITATEPPPVAEFSGTPTTGDAPLAVNFSDLSTGAVSSWSWTFGDGGTSTAQNPSHVYNTPGTYSVSLTVIGLGGSDGETKTGYITVSEPPPVAEFSGTPTTGDAPLAVNFSDLSAGAVTSWSWTFGDGGTSSAQNPSHVYNAAGTYSVTLTATGPGGADGETKAAYITVTEPAPVAEFSGAPTTGDAPLAVNFSDQSTGVVTSWSWTFSDGGTSTAQNPSHVYNAAGTYSVTLTATGPGGADGETKAAYITVTEPAPVAEFSGTPTTGDAPLAVNFSDLSTGAVTSWSWTFGDGGSSSAQNPSHVYNAAGTYTVSLTATGPGGSDGETKIGYITVGEPAPVAEFSGTPTSGDAPLAVNFSDLSTGAVSSWSWIFGDGGTSSLQDPSHVYNAAGTYTVSLTATGPGGSDGETKVGYITVTEPAPVAEFSGTPTTGDAPLAVNFSDLSTGAVTSWSWTFGDGGTSSLQDPSHVYNAAGTYTVSLTATGPGGSDGETKVGYITVTEPAPVAEFSGTPTIGDAPLAVNFSDLSTGAVTSWSWTFGDGGSSSAQNPSHVYNAAGTYSVTLTATGPGGSDGETKASYITVTEPAPVAEFSGTPTTGDAPLAVNFSDLSTGAVTAWSWTFGDGGTSAVQNPSHVYNAAGTYTVSLTATGPGGSDGETKIGYVTVGEPAPVAEFSGSPTSGIAPLAVNFSDLSSGAVTSWSWTFGDGGTSSLQDPSHVYNAPGTYTVSLTATGPGGSDGETKIGYITVNEPPPVAEFSGTPTSGTAPLAVDFSDLSSGLVSSWSWTFGDGGTSSAQNPSHVYNAAGTYTVSLTVIGLGGSDGETKVGYVTVSDPAPVAEFSGTPTSGLLPLLVDFTDLSTGPVTSWSWTFGDGGTSSAQNPSHTYLAAGSYTVSLTATGPGGNDTETKTAYVTVNEPAPVAEFSGTPTSGLAPLAVDFTDLSTGAVTSWSWTFGDGGSSGAQSPSHVYNTPGLYTVTLTATGPGGSDGETKTDYVVVGTPVTVTDVTPSAIEALVPGTDETVTVLGSGFTGGTVVSVNGTPVDAGSVTVVDSGELTFDMPQVAALGSATIEVDNGDDSATSSIEVVLVSSPELQCGNGDLLNPVQTPSGLDVIVAGQPGHLHFVAYSSSDLPSILPGYATLGLGNNFTDLFEASRYTIPAEGWTADNLPVPGSGFPPTVLYLQSLHLNAGLPVVVSNLQSVTLNYPAE